MFKKIFVATTNTGKLEEYKYYLEPLGYRIVGLKDLNIKAESEETGESYTEIAEEKADFYSKYSKLPIVADDSGLEILTLGNFPGINSERWLRGTSQDKNNAILHKLKNVKDRRAIFKTVLVYKHKGTKVRFEGQLYGQIVEKSSGVTGFGYDPIFYVPEANKTLADLTLIEKNKISHRGRALKKFVSYLDKYIPG